MKATTNSSASGDYYKLACLYWQAYYDMRNAGDIHENVSCDDDAALTFFFFTRMAPVLFCVTTYLKLYNIGWR